MVLMRRLPWHGAAWAALRSLHARGVHAVLLYGAAGIGKKNLALDFAQALLCESPDAQGYGCGACRGCVLAAAGTHPDLRVVVPDAMAALRGHDAAADDDAEAEPGAADHREGAKTPSREIRIEQVRELADFVGTTTFSGGVRVIVLAPAKSLNPASANALLKMLEEPPPATRFLLVSDSADDVLPTIRSRCVLQRVETPDTRLALQWLHEQGVDDPQTQLAAAGGAPLAALEESEQQVDQATRALLLAMLAQGSNLAPAEVAARVPRTLPLPAAIALFQRWGWDLLAYRAAHRVRYHPGHKASIARIADASTTPDLLAWLRSLGWMRATSEHPLNSRLSIEAALLSYIEAVQGTRSRASAESMA